MIGEGLIWSEMTDPGRPFYSGDSSLNEPGVRVDPGYGPRTEEAKSAKKFISLIDKFSFNPHAFAYHLVEAGEDMQVRLGHVLSALINQWALFYEQGRTVPGTPFHSLAARAWRIREFLNELDEASSL